MNKAFLASLLFATAATAATSTFAQVECELGEIKKWSGNRFQIEDITVTNTGNATVAWQVQVVFDSNVEHTGNWSSEVSASGNVFSVTGNSYNRELSANKSTDFGVKGEGAFSTVRCEVAGSTEQPETPETETPVVETPETETPVVETPETELPTVPVGEAVYQESFETLSLGAEWQRVDDTQVVNDCGAGRNQCLRVSYAPTDRGSDRLQTKVAIPAGQHYSLVYDIKFEDGFEFVRGGKLPGLAPTVHTTGCDEAIPNGWSARPMWRGEGSAQGYYYAQQRDERCGDGERSAAGTFKVGQWQRIELELKLNSATGAYDGFIKLMVDGEVVSKATEKDFREVFNNDTLINQFFFSTFYGGADPSWAPTKTTTILYDNIQVINRGGSVAQPVDPVDPVDETDSGNDDNTGNEGTGDTGACQQYTPTGKVELDLRQSDCVEISQDLSDKTLALWDSDENSSCDFRGSVVSINGSGTVSVTSNYSSSSVLSGTKIRFAASNGCNFVKMRAY